MPTENETVQLFNPNDGITGRDGGPYLDIEQAKLAEVRRALVEDREPDYDNLPAFAGIPLQTADEQFKNAMTNGVHSQANRNFLNARDIMSSIADSDDNALAVHSEREVINETAEEDKPAAFLTPLKEPGDEQNSDSESESNDDDDDDDSSPSSSPKTSPQPVPEPLPVEDPFTEENPTTEPSVSQFNNDDDDEDDTL